MEDLQRTSLDCLIRALLRRRMLKVVESGRGSASSADRGPFLLLLLLLVTFPGRAHNFCSVRRFRRLEEGRRCYWSQGMQLGQPAAAKASAAHVCL